MSVNGSTPRIENSPARAEECRRVSRFLMKNAVCDGDLPRWRLTAGRWLAT